VRRSERTGQGEPADAPDPLISPDDYASALARGLRGPIRLRRRMVAEMRDGLADAVAAYTGQGMPPERAMACAVREFGTPDEVAPAVQAELTIAQTRHTARAITVTLPLLVACWWLVPAGGHAWAGAMSGAAAVVGVAVAVVAAGAYATTGALSGRRRTPARLPRAMAWTGTAAGAIAAAGTLGSALASWWAADPAPGLGAVLLAGTAHALVAASARECRRCARLPAR